ncbi:hypothetical protein ACLKA6_007335 [Drosophila palustris]
MSPSVTGGSDSGEGSHIICSNTFSTMREQQHAVLTALGFSMQTKCLRIAKNGTQIRYLHMGHSWLPVHPLILESSPLQQQQQWQQQQKWQQQRRRRRRQRQQSRRWPSPCSACGNSATLEHQQQQQQDLQLQQQDLRRRQRRRRQHKQQHQHQQQLKQQRQQAKNNPNCHPYGIGDAASWRHIDAQLHPHPVGQQVSMQLNGSSCPSWAACCQI